MEQAQGMRDQREAMGERWPGKAPSGNVVPFPRQPKPAMAMPTKPPHWHSGEPMGIHRKPKHQPLAVADAA
jgi:hypothetical protein